MVRFKYNNGSIVGLPITVATQLQKIKQGIILEDSENAKKELKPKTKKKSK